MATGTATWTENQTDVDFDDITPADTSQATAIFDLAANGYDRIIVQIKIDWHASATDYADIILYSSSDSGGQVDVTPLWSQRIVGGTNDPEYISIIIDGIAHATVVFDNQSAQEVAELDIIYAGRKWDIT